MTVQWRSRWANRNGTRPNLNQLKNRHRPAAEPEPGWSPRLQAARLTGAGADQSPEPEDDFIEDLSGAHVAEDPAQATMRTGEFPIIRPTEEGEDEGGRHVLDEGERPAWFVPGKTSRRSRSRAKDDE